MNTLSNSTNIAYIPCSSKNGSSLTISYSFTTSTDTSSLSPKVTFYCASIPAAPNIPQILWNDISQIILSWSQPIDNGGSPIIGYQIYMKKSSESTFLLIYDGSYNPATTFLTIKTYNGSSLSNANYDFKLLCLNIVGMSSFTPVLTLMVQNLPLAANCLVSGSGLSTFPANTNVTINVMVI